MAVENLDRADYGATIGRRGGGRLRDDSEVNVVHRCVNAPLTALMVPHPHYHALVVVLHQVGPMMSRTLLAPSGMVTI